MDPIGRALILVGSHFLALARNGSIRGRVRKENGITACASTAAECDDDTLETCIDRVVGFCLWGTRAGKEVTMKSVMLSWLSLAAILTACSTLQPLQSDTTPTIPVPSSVREYTLNGSDDAPAAAVRTIDLGVGPDVALATSRGSADAVARGETPPYAEGFDRRVDIVLLGVVHAPR